MTRPDPSAGPSGPPSTSAGAPPPLWAFDAGAPRTRRNTNATAVDAATAARVTHPARRAAYWDAFYTRHGARFFKDRHWLDREFGGALAGARTLLEVGCGVGNAALMLAGGGGGGEDAHPPTVVYACDFSPTAVDLMVARAAEEGLGDRLVGFVADATVPGALTRDGGAGGGEGGSPPPPASIDVATLLFALSAMPPGPPMAAAVANMAAALRPGGRALVRDYCGGDLAQERLAGKKGGRRVEVVGEAGAAAAAAAATGGLFMRGDGTLAYYFDGAAELVGLFARAGFVCEAAGVVEATKVNRATGAEMPRRWVQGTFVWPGGGGDDGVAPRPAPCPAPKDRGRRTRARPSYRAEWEGSPSPSSSSSSSSSSESESSASVEGGRGHPATPPSPASSSASSGGLRAAARLLTGGVAEADDAPPDALPPLEPATLDLPPPLGPLTILAAHGEHRHTTSHTGLLVWGAAPALASVLCECITEEPRAAAALLRAGPVLEVGCGAAPGLALATLAAGAPRYVATDGSPPACALFARNFGAHAWRVVAERARVACLPWGEAQAAEELVREHTPDGAGFATVLGADVLYSAPAVPRLMATVAASLQKGSHSLALFCLQVRSVSLERVEADAAAAGLVAVPPPAGLAAVAAKGGLGRPGDLLQLIAFAWPEKEEEGGE